MSKFWTNIFLKPATLNYLWSSVVGAVKIDYFDFSCKKNETLHNEAICKWVNCAPRNYFELHTYGPQQFSKIGVVKDDYFDFPCEIFEMLCEFDVRVIACNF